MVKIDKDIFGGLYLRAIEDLRVTYYRGGLKCAMGGRVTSAFKKYLENNKSHLPKETTSMLGLEDITLADLSERLYMLVLDDFVEQENIEKANVVKQKYVLDGVPCDEGFWKRFTPIWDWRGGGIVYDNENGKLVTGFEFETFVFTAAPQQFRERWLQDKFFASLVYDPTKVSRFWTSEEGETPRNYFNLYKAPKWQELHPLDTFEINSLECPPRVMDFMKHLIPSGHERRQVFSWMREMLIKRSEMVLILTGGRGAGKNIFTDTILTPLAGKENTNVVAQEQIFNSRFNSYLENCRLLKFDEAYWGKDNYQEFKKILSEEQSLEKKGRDPYKVQSYLSLCVSNNSINLVYLEYDERRVLAPVVTQTDLKRVWTKDEIRDFRETFEADFRMQAQMAYWLIYKHDYIKYLDYEAKGERFWDIVEASLSRWQQYIMNQLVERSPQIPEDADYTFEVNVADIIDHADKGIKISTIRSFCDSYRYRDLFNIGKVFTRRKKQVFVASTEAVEYFRDKQKITDNEELLALV